MTEHTVTTLRFQMIDKTGRLCLIIEKMNAGMGMVEINAKKKWGEIEEKIIITCLFPELLVIFYL